MMRELLGKRLAGTGEWFVERKLWRWNVASARGIGGRRGLNELA